MYSCYACNRPKVKPEDFGPFAVCDDCLAPIEPDEKPANLANFWNLPPSAQALVLKEIAPVSKPSRCVIEVNGKVI